MRDLFPGYYRPTSEQFHDLWKECTLAFDANTLLNVYRYTVDTRERFLGIVERLAERVWVPHQAALEYHERRLDVIFDQTELYAKIENELDETLKSLEKTLSERRRHPFIERSQMLGAITSSFQKIKDVLYETRSNHPNFLTHDELRERITNLFNGKVGQPYSEDNLEKIYKTGEARFKQQIPPGYKDSTKNGTRKYNDFVIWSQLLDFARTNKTPIVFVTDDTKEDWWLIHKGKTIGPRPELVQEMIKEASVTFYMYQVDQFMTYAQDFFSLEDQQEAIEEAKEVRQREEKRQLIREGADKLAYLAGNTAFASDLEESRNIPLDSLITDKVLAQKLQQLQQMQEGFAAREGLLKPLIHDKYTYQSAWQDLEQNKSVSDEVPAEEEDDRNIDGTLGSTLEHDQDP